MTYFGKIKSYDTVKGAGMITPDKGGDALPFGRKDIEPQAQTPAIDQRYAYDTSNMDGAKTCAINLKLQQGESSSQPKQQASAQ